MSNIVYSDQDIADYGAEHIEISVRRMTPDPDTARFSVTLRDIENPSRVMSIRIRCDRIPALIGALAELGGLSVKTSVQLRGTSGAVPPSQLN